MMKKIVYPLYWLWSLTWGGIMTFIGLCVAIVLLVSGHKPKHLGPNVYFVVGYNWGGINFGPIFLTSGHGENTSKFHEAGHGLQNLIWGPLMSFVICIPSAVRYWYRELHFYKKGLRPTTTYDSIWFEGQATRWGNAVYNKTHK